ncbi:MAG: DUF167 domain-containing protein [Candidatus Moranbacteria bacterium]|nr:DUF167 domain-containing protein [Candidatus Moranbacteria bacterium]MBP9801235.1 DUF167 domain-containing protein [Candidatus Moranbacteria bacterium]
MTVKTNAREDQIEVIDVIHFLVSVKAAPREGKANDAVTRMLARHLGITRSSLQLKSGSKDKQKVFVLHR